MAISRVPKKCPIHTYYRKGSFVIQYKRVVSSQKQPYYAFRYSGRNRQGRYVLSKWVNMPSIHTQDEMKMFLFEKYLN